MENCSEGMMSQVTVLLERLREGEHSALNELMPLVYGELRRIAQSFFRRQHPGHTLQPTALVNEAFVKLFDDAQPEFSNRAHFLAVMARAMRQVLVDHARALGAAKRGGGKIQWDTRFEAKAGSGSRQLKVLEVHSALEALARENGSLAQVIEMHYFGGMTAEEAALVVGRSVHVVRHELRLAQAWMRRELAGCSL
jgi:RNA polymerase sigma-70 factor (ECF subfamily)